MLSRLIDSFIATLNPVAGMRRQYARKVMRGYSNAEPSRLNSQRRPKNQSANQEMRGPYGANELRAWARSLVRDNAWAWGVVDTYVSSVVGKGIEVQSSFEDESGGDIEWVNEIRDDVWSRWCETCELTGQFTFHEMQGLILREMIEAGECLVRLVTVPTKYRGRLRPVPLALELIEADRICEERDTWQAGVHGQNRVERGVELDELGAPVAYWVYPNHPNEMFRGRSSPIRIPATEMLHLFMPDRIGQSRGVTLFASVISWMRDLGVYVDNELQASAVAACFTAAIKSNDNAAGLVPGLAEQTTDSRGNSYEFLEPGLIMRLNEGEDLVTANPGRPNSGADPWIKLMLRAIAVGTGLSYETVARDYSQTSYSSNRASQLEDRRRFRRWQRYLINHLNLPVWDRFCFAAASIGQRGFPSAAELLANPRKAAPCENMPPSWEWVDPQVEQTSAQASIDNFQSTYAQELGALGRQWRSVFYQRAKEERLKAQLGLVKPGETPMPITMPGDETEAALGSGEMMGLSRLQWKRNRKAIEDVLADFVTGVVTETKAMVLLGGLGLNADSIAALLADAKDGSVDSLPADDNEETNEETAGNVPA